MPEPIPPHLLAVDWPALAAALALGNYHAAYGAAGLSRDAADYREAAARIEAHKADALAARTAAYSCFALGRTPGG